MMLLNSDVLIRRDEITFFQIGRLGFIALVLSSAVLLASSAAYASGKEEVKAPPPPPPSPPISCPTQDTIVYYNANSIGNCKHPQQIKARTLRYYYPSSGSCTLWKEIASNFSYQCVNRSLHFDCNSGSCSYFQYLKLLYSEDNKGLAEVGSETITKTWRSSSYDVERISRQMQYSTIRNETIGMSIDSITHESIREENDYYLYADLGRILYREGGNIHYALQIDVSTASDVCHIGAQPQPGTILEYETSKQINISETSGASYTGFPSRSNTWSKYWKRQISPTNICELASSLSDLEDPGSEGSNLQYTYVEEGDYEGGSITADDIYDDIKYGR